MSQVLFTNNRKSKMCGRIQLHCRHHLAPFQAQICFLQNLLKEKPKYVSDINESCNLSNIEPKSFEEAKSM